MILTVIVDPLMVEIHTVAAVEAVAVDVSFVETAAARARTGLEWVVRAIIVAVLGTVAVNVPLVVVAAAVAFSDLVGILRALVDAVRNAILITVASLCHVAAAKAGGVLR